MAENEPALYYKIKETNFKPIPNIYSSTLKEMVELMLTKDTSKRPYLEEIFKLIVM